MADLSTSSHAGGNSEAHGPAPELPRIVQALDLVYSPQSSNETRQAASSFLEDAKRHSEAPAYGYELARDRANPSTLRHYGLSVLEYCVKYTWDTYSQEQGQSLRERVIQLAFDTDHSDLLYIRNKIAQLWVEAAKRSWVIDWMNMDELLVRLWDTSLVHRQVVLSILETLSDETFVREDPALGTRTSDLGQACVDIFVPAVVFSELHPNREPTSDLRYGSDGWLQRISTQLGQCIESGAVEDEQTRTTAGKCLTTMRAAFGWIMFRSVSAIDCSRSLAAAASVGGLSIRTGVVEAWLAIYSRSSFHDEDFSEVVAPMFHSEIVGLLRTLYQYSIVNADDLDDGRYILNKKITELLNCLGTLLEQRLHLVTDAFDIQAFISLLFDVMHNPSLLVSIPVLHLWTKFLRSNLLRDTPYVTNCIGGLLEVCSQRLIRYENVPDDSNDPTFHFLTEDIDTIPERHAFLGNYRRYCMEVIEVIVRKLPVDAITHILEQAMKVFGEVAHNQQSFQPQNFTKNSPSVLRIDAQITVIEAAMKGYLKWRSAQGEDAQTNERDRSALQDLFERCGQHVMSMEFRDPELKRKISQLLVSFATKPLYDKPSFASQLLENLLSPIPKEDPSLQLYNEAQRSLQSAVSQDLSRLAMAFPDHFLSMFDDLQQRISKLVASNTTDDKQEMGYQAFLFIIIHRSSGLDLTSQKAQLTQMLQPMKDVWQDPGFAQKLSTFDAFCDLIGLSSLADFVLSRRFHEIQDWSHRQLDDEGKTLQDNILSRCHQLPLRLTKALLAAATEKVEDDTPQWEISCALWADLVPLVLPNLLKLTSYAQAFNNPQSWSSLPKEMQNVISRMLTDRFWQAGISTESREDFFARVSSSKSSYEGFASTVRGTVRQIRETGYWIIYGFIRFKSRFYGIDDLATPLSEALYANASALSAHHFSVLLNMSVQLIEGCPPELRKQFLPPVLSGLFLQLDRKISGEWDMIGNRGEHNANGSDGLGDEMKSESILRQLTYTAVSLAYSLVDYHRPEALETRHADTHGRTSTTTETSSAPRMHTFVLTTDAVLGPILMFLQHALRFRDTRSVTLAVRTLRNTLPSLPLKDPEQGPGVRRFLSDELLKTAITSLHEPYYIDVQKDLASLIAHILSIGPGSESEDDLSRHVLLSLPGLSTRPDKVDSVLLRLRHQLTQHGGQMGDRQSRALVLDLLKDVRGQSIQEMGRIMPAHGGGSGRKSRKERSRLQEQYMSVDGAASGGGIGQGAEESLAGIADMFSRP